MDGIIELKVNGNSIVKDGSIAGARYEANSKKLRIIFGDDWNGFGKTITFWNALGENPVNIQLGTNLLEDIQVSQNVYIVPIPGEAMTEAGENTFVIQGYTDGVIKRSVGAKLRVLDSPIADDADIPSDVTPAEIEQLRSEIDSVVNDIAVVRQAVDITTDIIANAEQFLDEAEIHALGAEEAKVAIESMTVSSETLEVGAEPTVEKSIVNSGTPPYHDIFNLHFGIPTSASGVYIGTEEPTDPNVNVWIVPDGSEDMNSINLKDVATGINYGVYVANGELRMGKSNYVGLNEIGLCDVVTGTEYILYILDGNLRIKESEGYKCQ